VAVPQIILAIIANQPPVLGRAIFWNNLGRQVMALFWGARSKSSFFNEV